jgi:hypothetical protein
MVPDKKLSELFPDNDQGQTWTRALDPTRKATADAALVAVAKLASDWGFDLADFETDIVDITDLHLPALGPWIVLQNKANLKTQALRCRLDEQKTRL